MVAVSGELPDVPFWVVLPEIIPGVTVAVSGALLELLLPLRWFESDDFVLLTVVLPEVPFEFVMLLPLVTALPF